MKYMQSHPDARSYRVKTVPSYHKLRVIFGEEMCDRRYNRLAQNAGTDGDVTALMTCYGMYHLLCGFDFYLLVSFFIFLKLGCSIFSTR